MTAEEPEHGAQRQLNPMASMQMVSDFSKRYIRCGLDECQDLVAECVNPMGSNITARLLGGPTASLPPALNPLDCGRYTNPKPLRRSTARHPAVYRCNDPFA